VPFITNNLYFIILNFFQNEKVINYSIYLIRSMIFFDKTRILLYFINFLLFIYYFNFYIIFIEISYLFLIIFYKIISNKNTFFKAQ